MSDDISFLAVQYIRAHRCYVAGDHKTCQTICNKIDKRLSSMGGGVQASESAVSREQLKSLLWSLRSRRFAAETFVDESLLLEEEEVQADEGQIRQVSRGSLATTTQSGARTTRPQTARVAAPFSRASNLKSSGAGVASLMASSRRPRTGMLTGSRQAIAGIGSRGQDSSSGRMLTALSAYRPLTASLTATQTAYSQSTRAYLAYANCRLIAKQVYEHLFCLQQRQQFARASGSGGSTCADYRQCLEYLSMQKAANNAKRRQLERLNHDTTNLIGTIQTDSEDHNCDNNESDTFWHVAHGCCYFKLNMLRQSEESFRRALNYDPRLLDAYVWLIKVYLRLNQPKDILNVCDQGLEHCKSAILHNWKARVMSLSGDLYAANTSLRDSLLYFPTNIEALANVGHFAFYDDRLDLALHCFEIIDVLISNNRLYALDINRSQAQLLNNLALCHLHCGSYEKVVPLLQRALLATRPGDNEVVSDIWYNMSFATMKAGLIGLTMDCLRLALKYDPQNQAALNNLGVIKFGNLITRPIHFPNKHELWTTGHADLASMSPNGDDNHITEDTFDETIYAEAETYFTSTISTINEETIQCEPEMIHNLAVLKWHRGQFEDALKYCNAYDAYDSSNCHIEYIKRNIGELLRVDA